MPSRFWRILPAAVAAAASIAALGCDSGAGDKAELKIGYIVFASNRDGDFDIYATTPNGRVLAKLTDFPGNESRPLPSPDGKKIAFLRSESEALYVMDADGSHSRRLSPSFSYGPTSWSPDSRWVISSDTDGIAAYEMSSSRRRTMGEACCAGPVWSPNGARIAVGEESIPGIPNATFGRTGIYVLQADGTHVRHLTNFYGDVRPSWSRDSSSIVFGRHLPGAEPIDRSLAIYLVGADGTRLRRLSPHVENYLSAAWSPKDDWIAFASRRAKQRSTGIYLIRPDGSAEHRVATGSAGNEIGDLGRDSLDWSADGSKLAYIRTRSDADPYSEHDIYVLDIGTQQARRVTFPADGGDNLTPHWVTGTLEGRPAIAAPSVTLRPQHVLRTEEIHSLATDGNRVALVAGRPGSCERVLIWEPGEKRLIRKDFRHAVCGVGAIEELALAGDRVAWISRMADRQESFECLFAAPIAGASTRMFGSARCEATTAVHVASGQCYQCPEGRGLAGLHGGGSLIAYNSMSYCFVTDPRSCNRGRREGSLVDGIWRLAGPRKQRVPQKTQGQRVLDVAAGRILTVRGSEARVLTADGTAVAQIRLPSPIDGAALAGTNLVTLKGFHLDVRDLQGRELHGWRLSPGRGARPELQDVRSGVAAIAVGSSLRLLRLSDGKEIQVEFRNPAPPLYAAFGTMGLVYAYNAPNTRRHGFVAVISTRELASAFARARRR
jgi:Tol biopolymer transport system component